MTNWVHPEVFAFLQIFLALGAALTYYYVGDWKRGTYWAAAAVLTLMVTL